MQEQKQRWESQAHAEERAGEVKLMGKAASSLWQIVMKSSLCERTHILAADTSPACVTVLESSDATVQTTIAITIWPRNYRLRDQEMSIWASQSQFCKSLGATRWWWQELNSTDAVDLGHVTNPQGRVCTWGWTYTCKSCNVEQIFILLLRFISTLETRLVFAFFSHKGLYSSIGWLPPALIQECQL